MASRKNKESLSKQVRTELFKHWEKGNQEEEFDVFYARYMTKVLMRLRDLRLNDKCVE